jgi:branched-subunit amino acid transport protein
MTLLELAAICGMALATWLTRTVPLLLRLEDPSVGGFAQRFLQNLPAALLAALVSPKLAGGDASIWLGALFTFGLVWKFKSVLIGVAAGTLACALLRWPMGIFG